MTLLSSSADNNFVLLQDESFLKVVRRLFIIYH